MTEVEILSFKSKIIQHEEGTPLILWKNRQGISITDREVQDEGLTPIAFSRKCRLFKVSKCETVKRNVHSLELVGIYDMMKEKGFHQLPYSNPDSSDRVFMKDQWYAVDEETERVARKILAEELRQKDERIDSLENKLQRCEKDLIEADDDILKIGQSYRELKTKLNHSSFYDKLRFLFGGEL